MTTLNFEQVADGMKTLLWVQRGASWAPTDETATGPIGAATYLLDMSDQDFSVPQLAVEVFAELAAALAEIGRTMHDGRSQTTSGAAVCRVAMRHGYTDPAAIEWAAWLDL